MTLDPDRYECPDHHTNLTSQVRQALEGTGPPVAYRRPLFGRPTSAGRPFRVIVTCPGTSSAPPHSLTCTGTHTP